MKTYSIYVSQLVNFYATLEIAAKDEAEAEAIKQALNQTNWNRKQAAALLKISYKALLYKIRQYGIAQTSTSHHKLSAGA